MNWSMHNSRVSQEQAAFQAIPKKWEKSNVLKLIINLFLKLKF